MITFSLASSSALLSEIPVCSRVQLVPRSWCASQLGTVWFMKLTGEIRERCLSSTFSIQLFVQVVVVITLVYE